MNKNTFLILLIVPLSVLVAGIAFEAIRRLVSRQLREQTFRSVRRLGLTETIRRELGTPRIREEAAMKTQSVSGTTAEVFLKETEWIQRPTISTGGEEVADATRYFGVALVGGTRIQTPSGGSGQSQ